MLPVSVVGCKNEALIKMHLKSIIKCFKKENYASDQKYNTHSSPSPPPPPPIDCSGRIHHVNGEPDCLFTGDIQS